jgi:serine/threonine protein kinase
MHLVGITEMGYQDSFSSGNQNQGESKASPQQISDLQPGAILGGRYEVVSLLGVGGMGVVYRVNQIFLDKHFALKTIGKLQTSDTKIRRFQLEARAAFAVNHPNIIAVNDFGLLDDGTPFLVMELIEGQTLTDRLKEKGGKLAITDVIQIFVQACFGLAYAHENGIVHRDIKPSNIMILNGIPLSSEGSVKIVDFGIAKFAQHDDGEVQALTKTGEIFGSPLYMSPEQCSGEHVDYRSDIYSLGCVLFEALTGTPLSGVNMFCLQRQFKFAIDMTVISA